MIRNFTCHNFRNISVDNLDLGRINLLIGPNNSGKSNLIRAISFCSDMLLERTNGGLSSAFLNAVYRNGWDHMHNRLTDVHQPIDLQWDMDIGEETVRYLLSFTVGRELADNQIVHESLNGIQFSDQYDRPFNYFDLHIPIIGKGEFSSSTHKGEKRNTRLTAAVSSQDSILLQFRDVLLNNKKLYSSDNVRVNIAALLQKLEDRMTCFYTSSGAGINSRAVRSPQDSRQNSHALNKDCSNLSGVLNYYLGSDLSWKAAFINHMSDLMQDLKQLDVVTEYDRFVLKMAYDGGQYDLSDVSEGTIKGLIYNFLINMPQDKPLEFLAIDEPEMNLHPAWQKVIAQWIIASDNVNQFMISTHSPDFLDSFTEGFRQGSVKVFILDNYGLNPIRQVHYEDIREDLGDWTLGDLYRTNDPALGGWPW